MFQHPAIDQRQGLEVGDRDVLVQFVNRRIDWTQFDDFIAKANGRIFNTAGDAVLAEFPSVVDAVRCAIDIQESLRTRNMAYPTSRQMSCLEL